MVPMPVRTSAFSTPIASSLLLVMLRLGLTAVRFAAMSLCRSHVAPTPARTSQVGMMRSG